MHLKYIYKNYWIKLFTIIQPKLNEKAKKGIDTSSVIFLLL